MSFILDALKKAEAERDPEARASLAMAQHQRRRSRWLAYAIVIALIANAVILLWLFLPGDAQREAHQERARAGQQQIQREPPTQPPPVGTSSRPPGPAAPAPSVDAPPASTATPSGAAESTAGDTVIGPDNRSALASEPLPVGSLPNSQRNRFPALSFSTHIYADDADLRAIVVNGTRLQEGDRLENLYLHQITENGAVFRFEGRLVSVSVLDEWN